MQLIYISSAVRRPATADILAVSSRNNDRDGITGLLYADGTRFLQVLEGPAHMVEATYDRIVLDPRHRAPVVLSRRTVDTREFGQWAMVERWPGEDGDAFITRVDAVIAHAEPNLRATFDGLMRLRRVA